MKFLSSSTIGIDQGDDVLFSDYEDGGDMWTGRDTRSRRKSVVFSSPFLAPPTTFVTLSMWDFDSATNARADITAENVTETGFDVVFCTWGDTKVARARIRWMAIGPIASDDDWALY